jgi:transcriptional regulator GlxA family with amidase domain
MLFGVFIYPGAEPIDLATYGVLSMARRLRPEIAICTVAPTAGVVAMANGLRVLADHGADDAPKLDMLVVTGGPGWEMVRRDEAVLAFLRRHAADAPIVSVCTGAMILAAAGLLDGLPATTKREVVAPEVPPIQRLAREHPAVAAHEAVWVDAGRVVTGGGVTLCIDTMLHVLARIFGEQMAAETARSIEYTRAWRANQLALPPLMASGV